MCVCAHMGLYVLRLYLQFYVQWVFIQMNPTWKGNREQLYKDTEEFFRTRSEGIPWVCSFFPLTTFFLSINQLYQLVSRNVCLDLLVKIMQM